MQTTEADGKLAVLKKMKKRMKKKRDDGSLIGGMRGMDWRSGLSPAQEHVGKLESLTNCFLPFRRRCLPYGESEVPEVVKSKVTLEGTYLTSISSGDGWIEWRPTVEITWKARARRSQRFQLHLAKVS